MVAVRILDMVAIAVLASLLVVFVLLPWAAYLALLEWRGKIKEPRDPLRDEWERWEARNPRTPIT
jgi:hypothetical protein